jgi:hypothetical protein
MSLDVAHTLLPAVAALTDIFNIALPLLDGTINLMKNFQFLFFFFLLQLALQPLVGFGLLYDFVPPSSIFALLSPILTFIFFKSSSTCSNHLSLGLPTGLDKYGSHSVSLFLLHPF